jgi:hypothetical protein
VILASPLWSAFNIAASIVLAAGCGYLAWFKLDTRDRRNGPKLLTNLVVVIAGWVAISAAANVYYGSGTIINGRSYRDEATAAYRQVNRIYASTAKPAPGDMLVINRLTAHAAKSEHQATRRLHYEIQLNVGFASLVAYAVWLHRKRERDAKPS